MRQAAILPARGILLSAYGILLTTLLLGALRRDTPLIGMLFPIALIIGLGQYPSG